MGGLGAAVDTLQAIETGLLAEDALGAGTTEAVAQVGHRAKPLLTAGLNSIVGWFGRMLGKVGKS